MSSDRKQQVKNRGTSELGVCQTGSLLFEVFVFTSFIITLTKIRCLLIPPFSVNWLRSCRSALLFTLCTNAYLLSPLVTKQTVKCQLSSLPSGGMLTLRCQPVRASVRSTRVWIKKWFAFFQIKFILHSDQDSQMWPVIFCLDIPSLSGVIRIQQNVSHFCQHSQVWFVFLFQSIHFEFTKMLFCRTVNDVHWRWNVRFNC